MGKPIHVELYFEGHETDQFIKDLNENGWHILADTMAHQVRRQCKCVDCNCSIKTINHEEN